MPKSLKEFERGIDVSFHNTDLLRQAFIHRSYVNEHPDEAIEHNERLEFLGDAVLELVVTAHLFNNYPNPEGELTSWRAALVNTQTLAQVAEHLNMNEYLYLSRGESRDTGRARRAILANAVEALIGALYLDQGYEAAQTFIETHILSRLSDVLDQKLYQDAKSHLQEIAQEKVGVTPAYKVLSEEGPDHAKQFHIGVYLDDDLIGEGAGNSKQEAEQSAAQAALEAKKWA